MLRVSSALEKKKLARQNNVVDWDSLLTIGNSFALQWLAPATRKAIRIWVNRMLGQESPEFRIELLSSWAPEELRAAAAPPEGLRAAATPAAPTPKTIVLVTPAHKAARGKTLRSSAAASSSAQAAAAASSQARAFSPCPPSDLQPSVHVWPQHKTLKLLLSGWTHRLVGEVSPEEWYHSLGKEIGRGSYGTVRMASRRGEDFAIKVFPPKHKLDATKVDCSTPCSHFKKSH
jgi:hypothetical protein